MVTVQVLYLCPSENNMSGTYIVFIFLGEDPYLPSLVKPPSFIHLVE